MSLLLLQIGGFFDNSRHYRLVPERLQSTWGDSKHHYCSESVSRRPSVFRWSPPDGRRHGHPVLASYLASRKVHRFLVILADFIVLRVTRPRMRGLGRQYALGGEREYTLYTLM